MCGRTKSRKLSRMAYPAACALCRVSVSSCVPTREVPALRRSTAAYSRQTCPDSACGFVHKDNRHGERFQCLRLGHAGDADVIASLNSAARMDDPDIHLWIPKEALRGHPHAEVPLPLGRGFGPGRSGQESSRCARPVSGRGPAHVSRRRAKSGTSASMSKNIWVFRNGFRFSVPGTRPNSPVCGRESRSARSRLRFRGWGDPAVPHPSGCGLPLSRFEYRWTRDEGGFQACKRHSLTSGM